MKRLRLVVLLLLLSLLLVPALPAQAHDGEDHLPPGFSSVGQDSSAVTLTDVGKRTAQILDNLIGTRWRDKNWPVAKPDDCFYNLDNPGLFELEKDLCALWEAQVIDSNIQPGARPYSCPWPENPPGMKCIDIHQTFDRNYAADFIWNAIFKAYINNVELDSDKTGTSPPKWMPSQTHIDLIAGHGRRYVGGFIGDRFSSSLMNFSWPCGEAKTMYNAGGGPTTCNHGRAHQIYTDIQETDTGSYLNKVARLSYPDLQIIEPWSRELVPQSKWNPVAGFEPQFGGAEPATVGVFKMWTSRMYCSLLGKGPSDNMGVEILITPACNNGYFDAPDLTGHLSYWWDGGMTPTGDEGEHGPHWNVGVGGLAIEQYSMLSRWWGWDNGPEPSEGTIIQWYEPLG